jgi:hypothetical protein
LRPGAGDQVFSQALRSRSLSARAAVAALSACAINPVVPVARTPSFGKMRF